MVSIGCNYCNYWNYYNYFNYCNYCDQQLCPLPICVQLCNCTFCNCTLCNSVELSNRVCSNFVSIGAEMSKEQRQVNQHLGGVERATSSHVVVKRGMWAMGMWRACGGQGEERVGLRFNFQTCAQCAVHLSIRQWYSAPLVECAWSMSGDWYIRWYIVQCIIA